MYLRDIASELYFPLKLSVRSKQTQRHFGFMLDDFERFLKRRATIDDLNDVTVSRFRDWIVRTPNRRGQQRGPRLANNRIDVLRAFWNWAAKRGLVALWPTFEKLQEIVREPDGWLLRELKALLKSCRAERRYVGHAPGDLWWTALHLVWWDCGERNGATLQVEWSHLSHTGVLIVPAHLRKGGSKPMDYHLKPKTMKMLAKLREFTEPYGRIFFYPFSISTFYNRYNAILERAGLPANRYSKGQKMRRSFASHLEANGGNATEALGHSRRSVTTRSYLDRRIVTPKRHNELLPDL